MPEVIFKCLKLTQPIGDFYIGSMACKDVVDISFADVRRIKDRDIERYVGIQRKLNPNRVKDIKKYVNHMDATFPTGVILAIGSENLSYSSKTLRMTVTRDDKVAQIIDGQHRIAGLQNFSGKFDLPVTIFVDMDLQDKAMTFATINLQQTKVSKSLVYDLYAFQKSRSPVKTCHQIARLLNTEQSSPLFERIKILGVASGPEQSYQNITQAAFVESLVEYISNDPDDDRDILRRGKKLPAVSDSLRRKLIFREMFVDQEDAEIARIVSNLFGAVADRWPIAWASSRKGDILNKTTGFKSFMKLLGPLFQEYGSAKKLPLSKVKHVLAGVDMRDSDFTKENFKPGGSGVSDLYKKLILEIGLK